MFERAAPPWRSQAGDRDQGTDDGMASNDRWSFDFVSDQFIDGRRFRILTVVDDCTRECLALVADTSLSGVRVARELDRLMIERQAEDGGQRQWQRRHPDMG
jgi:transposase InsO family protein